MPASALIMKPRQMVLRVFRKGKASLKGEKRPSPNPCVPSGDPGLWGRTLMLHHDLVSLTAGQTVESNKSSSSGHHLLAGCDMRQLEVGPLVDSILCIYKSTSAPK